MTILTLQGLWPTHHGDVTQLVNSRYCVLALCVLGISHVVIAAIYYKEPVHCFCPSHMTGPQCDIIKARCLSQNGFKFEEDFTFDDELQQLATHSYYNHISMILFLQAFLFYLPSVVWRELARKIGFLPEELSLAALETSRLKDVDDKESAIDDMANSLRDFCLRQLKKRHLSYAFRWFHGNQLVLSRLFSKLIYMVNVFGQFYMLDAFLGLPFHALGYRVFGKGNMSSSIVDHFNGILASLGINNTWQLINNVNDTSILNQVDELLQEIDQHLVENNSATFHVDFLCDFKSTIFGQIQSITIHCHLPMNSLNELLFICVWFLMCSVAVVTTVSLCLSTFQLAIFQCRRMGIRERLQNIGTIERPDPSDTETINKIDRFEQDFLQRDGLFLMTYIEAGAGDLVTDKVLDLLWKSYEETGADIERLVEPVKWIEQFVEVVDEIPVSGQNPEEGESTTIFIPMQAQSLEQAFGVPPPYVDIGPTAAIPYRDTENSHSMTNEE